MSYKIQLTDDVAIPVEEISLRFARSGGPGGQNVNKVSTRVIAEFDVAGSPNLSAGHREQLLTALASRLTNDGVLIVSVQDSRSQWKNREVALDRVVAILKAGLARPRVRVATRPTRNSRNRTLQVKKHRATIKKLRRRPARDGEP